MTGHAAGRLPLPTLLAYVLPAFAVALPTIPVFLHVPHLYGVEMGLGLAATGLLLLAARIIDTVADPLVGLLSDRLAWRGRHRKPWIAAGAVLAGLGLFQLLNPPSAVGASHLFGWSVVLYVGWTMMSVPYTAWGAELSADYHERTRITSWREGLAVLGIIAAGGVHALVAAFGWDDRAAVGAIGWLAILGGAVTVPLLLVIVPDLPPVVAPVMGPAPVGSLPGWRRAVRSLAANRPFLRLLAAWFLNGLANGIPAVLFFLYLEHGLAAGERTRPLFVLLYFAAAILAIPLWQLLSRRHGKHVTWCWAMIAACAAFLTVPWIPPGSLAAFATVCVVTGMALGADLALPPSMQADVVDYGALRTRQPAAGLHFALWAMGSKLALAFAVGLALPALEALGFDPAAPDGGGRAALIGLYAVLPVLIKGLAIALVWSFPLTADRQRVIQRWLSRPHGLRAAVTRGP